MTLSFDFEDEARRELSRWKSLLPQVKDSYQPSGLVPWAAYPWMLAGGMVSIPVAIVAGALVLTIGSVVIYLLTLLNELIYSLPLFFYVVFMVVFGAILLLSFVFWLGAYIAIGGAAGAGVGYFARFGKSRGRFASGAISAVAAATSVVGFFLVVQWAVNPPWGDLTDLIRSFFGQGIPGFGESDFGILAWVNGVLGTGTALAVAVMAGGSVDKFCEECGEYHVRESLEPTRLESAHRMVNAGKSSAALADAYEPVKEGPISVVLFRCPRCGSGFLEMQAQFEAKYQKLQEKHPRTLAESWLCACIPLGGGEAASFGKAVRADRP